MVAIQFTDFQASGRPRLEVEVVFKPRMVGEAFRQGSYVHLASNRRILGWVVKDAKRARVWRWYPADEAFRGDGPDDLGLLADGVPNYLTRRKEDLHRYAYSRAAATELLVQFLCEQRAPALGYGRHPDVRRQYDDDDELREWAKTGYGEYRTVDSATKAVIRNLHRSTGMWSEAWEQLSMETEEDFREGARRYLGDKSELRTGTLDRADWSVVFAHFVAEKKGF
jgi:hypothetical protein